MYFIYAEKDPHCSCCPWQYSFSTHETFEEAESEAAYLETEGYRTTLINGEEITLSSEVIARAKGRKEAESKARIEALKREEENRQRRQYEELKRKFGD